MYYDTLQKFGTMHYNSVRRMYIVDVVGYGIRLGVSKQAVTKCNGSVYNAVKKYGFLMD